MQTVAASLYSKSQCAFCENRSISNWAEIRSAVNNAAHWLSPLLTRPKN